MEEQVEKLKTYMEESENTVAVTGSGISYLSGMRTFKNLAGPGWQRKVSDRYVKSHPEEVYALFREAFLDAIFEKGPSKVHYQLAELEEKGLIQGIVTQNLDGLHTMAGSKNVVSFMGSFADSVCLDCGETYQDMNLWNEGKMPVCEKCGGYLLPVYFNRLNEGIRSGKNPWMEEAKDMIAKAELLIVIGTTGFHSDEYLSKLRKETGIVQINPGHTMFDEMAVLNINEDAETVLDQILDTE